MSNAENESGLARLAVAILWLAWRAPVYDGPNLDTAGPYEPKPTRRCPTCKGSGVVHD